MADHAAALDAADPLAACRDLFVPAQAGPQAVQAYLDGNSLGRPLRATAARMDALINGAWGTGLIRSWDQEWMDLPMQLGDRLGQICLGAAPGQTVIGDSTTVLLHKWLHAAVGAARTADPQRNEIVLDTENFPTDRYVAEQVAADTGCRLVWIEPEPTAGVQPAEVARVVGHRTAVVLVSHVAYKSAWVADLAAITGITHRAGALVLWDLCHSTGVLPIDLDQHEVDLAVGCSYKFLNGGPGAPAFGYVATRHQAGMRQPIPGWMGHADPFAMGPTHRPAQGMRRFLSGTPPILGMVGIADTLEVIEEVGLAAISTKATALGEFVIAMVDAHLPGVGLGSPRQAERRGGHVTLTHPRAGELCRRLWEQGIIPDFREPDGIRLGLSPLSTSYAEVAVALTGIADLIDP